ncbi:MAG: ATP-dependent DNA helicase [Kordiimonadaceae bacterium]|jgi:ATP-dependent DNA helicase DinG|nr:ATP-dependent DNA helicase [Kordiimonadaceae bacterium]MBT6031556.1 ATP-dependent DNA helicase [Kordiimonadaceae bacterium]
MTSSLIEFPDPFEALTKLPALVVGPLGGVIMTSDGEVEVYEHSELRKIIRGNNFLVCNLPVTSRRLNTDLSNCYDLLELFAFVRPATFCLPLPLGISLALEMPPMGDTHEEEAAVLLRGAILLIEEVTKTEYAYPEGAKNIAFNMSQAGWRWGPIVLAALGGAEKQDQYQVWNHLSEWEEKAPPPPPGQQSISKKEAEDRLFALLGDDAEKREGQVQYAGFAAKVFDLPEEENEPVLVLSEAGTGIGKTLGYIAPSSLWAEKNGGTVWLSTYTKNLQRQLDQELDRLYPDPKIKNQKVVVRKGRENYVCLLNLQEISGMAAQPQGKILLGLVSRWARYSRDGDMIGGDFPAWLGETFGAGRLSQLTDRRGECVYSACSHYKKCFIEKAQRKAKQANLVIANHALVMVQSATRQGESDLPTRYVFDEGHHVFDAADGVFSAHLTGQEGLELRRWIRGAEIQNRRGKGLKGRLDDLLADDEEAGQYLRRVYSAAACLSADGWHLRLLEGGPFGPMEKFLSFIRTQIFSRTYGQGDFHSIETFAANPVEGLTEAAGELKKALDELIAPLKRLSALLLKKLDAEADELDSATRNRLESISRSITRRCEIISDGWCPMLAGFIDGLPANENYVDWFELSRIQGRETDVGMYRHWIDPSIPFANVVLKPSHGALITSATLRDRLSDNQNPDIEWNSAEIRTGAAHFITPPARHSLKSPFDYEKQSRVFIVNDLNNKSLDQLAAAYRELFIASGGGGLGLFTAISRLKGVYSRIVKTMEEEHIPLFGQHIDPINVGTLVDIFRTVENSCLLGTDAVRDGVDVPGNSLRLCVFDKVPWPRPTILHKARREHFGKQTYDDLLTRLRMKQAFGRLIRKKTDKGVFVMLDGASPTRLLSGLPESVIIERIGLAETIRKTKEFLTEAD